ncbi:hypothetical protein [Campylobacter sp. US33a]|uniref:capsular polysaccharide export protein, LipB/KpsS family n=1 Tax=Campylobacter sp. US33a TaxID=2498120 RepID=UPI0010688764|nr:hypothetical protein [Campylobacter sp. US33a]TEY03447.1 hypothetical protein ELQ16_02520 [Campylobacter sp. US33a]
MMKIILLDSDLTLIEQFLSHPDINIQMLIANKAVKGLEKYKNVVNFIYPRGLAREKTKIIHKIKYNLTYKEIEEFRNTQIKVENYYRRFFLDMGFIQNLYYKALSFWLDFFNNNQIDMIFSNQIEHGGDCDSIPFDIAKKLNIPIYILSLSCGNNNWGIYQILYYNEKKFLKITDSGMLKVNLKEYFNPKTQDKVGLKKPIKYFFKTRIKTLARVAQKMLLGEVAEYDLICKRDFCYLFKHEIYQQAHYIKNLRKIYNKIATQPEWNEKFIYFPLHLEPEASIMNRTILSSQLFIIELLSVLLPSGWKIYVKEHPHQFFIYEQYISHIRNIHYFRGLRFYETLESIKNVRIIDINANSSKLIQAAQVICGIGSTSQIEAVYNQKPVLHFGENTSFIELLQECFNIRSKNDLEKALVKISQGFKPKYDDLEFVLENYTFLKIYGKEDIKNILQLILKHAETIKK